jgi:hypothetical protein
MLVRRRWARPRSPALPGASEPRWLAPGIAADLFFTPDPGGSDRAAAEALRLLRGDDPVDVVVQSAAHRRKKLLVADMDSTMIGQECIDELADCVGLLNVWPAALYLTARKLRWRGWQSFGEMDRGKTGTPLPNRALRRCEDPRGCFEQRVCDDGC